MNMFKVGERVKPVGFQYGIKSDEYGTVISVSKSGYTGDDLYEVRWDDNNNIVKYTDVQIEKLTKCERIMDAMGIKAGEAFALVDPDTGETYCSPYYMANDGNIMDDNGEKLGCDEYAEIFKGHIVSVDKAKKIGEINEKINQLCEQRRSLLA
ncbi:hypothetical protein SELR_pSRC300830 (plasmid) [Selenomonas ruminantium subsp. lactilytica TAM6421]|uniref:Uncharacterized protein n=1 Tax=Selenomonas ruminantium subsp. lactilytica (strain NBRC 103574 / TAM6421) TaxID=927704 RepID=I0GWL9_SELRL|nr:hypothetical protein [Selenomonas ruminantium]BAL85156.1 hypothetical protein SELR_pSRC300830 [Selenomonas ruminantium subsp. lactilytica TAM6421]